MVSIGLNDRGNEMTATTDGFTVTQTSANITGAPTLLFIHGFLDDATVWDGVIASLAGKVNTVRYEQINTMLLNEFLKEHRTVQGLKASLGQQQKEIATLIAHIKEQDVKIQKVSDQLEMSRAAPRVASVK